MSDPRYPIGPSNPSYQAWAQAREVVRIHAAREREGWGQSPEEFVRLIAVHMELFRHANPFGQDVPVEDERVEEPYSTIDENGTITQKVVYGDERAW